MKLEIFPSLIFRTPKFSFNAELSDCWNELKEAIKISSESFYLNIKDVEAKDLDKLPPKVQFTVWKYFNRAKYRSTPYGTFASFSLLNLAKSELSNQIVVRKKEHIHDFVDWPTKNQIHFSIQELFNQNVELYSNNSYYHVAGSTRYIACTEGQFELAEIEFDNFVLKILELCSKPIRYNDLISSLDVDEEEVEYVNGLLDDMLSLQLLFSDHDPNIIGDDYFERIAYKTEPNSPKYIISEREILSGKLDQHLLSDIPNLISILQRILPVNEQTALKKFINRFVKKFEQNEIPLVIALDPEMGVGYDDLEQGEQSDDFIAQFKKNNQVNPADANLKKFKENFKTFFSNDEFEQNRVIFLDKMNFESAVNKQIIPNSFSLIMSVVDDQVCIDQLGGYTANALNGRFTLASNAVLSYTKSIAEIERVANQEVLFFDVAYMVESNVDNINRRKRIYEQQLSILNFDTSENPLILNDIMISVQGQEVVLRSKKYNKRLIPKISSAYNYARSDLSVFRLFCDLQHQGLQTNLSISLSNLFPDKDYYPRFQYKNLILSRAKWKVNATDLLRYLGKDPKVENCRAFLQKLGVSRYFKTGLADQTLTFDQENTFDISSFIQYIQKQTTSYLEEVLLPVSSNVVDEQSTPYLAQFIVSLTHDQQIYKPANVIRNVQNIAIKQVFPPGSEWLYFEIYCHQQRADFLLLTAIKQFLHQHQNEIRLWFFIRYNENGNHIRLRILLNEIHDGQKLTSSLAEYLNDYLSSGLVSDLTIKTYKREAERYGYELIEEVEKHFNIDSEYVFSLLETGTGTNQKYRYCAELAFSIQQNGIFNHETFRQVIQLISDSFGNEHRLEVADFKKLNAHYQLYKAEEIPALYDNQQEYLNTFSKSFIEILKKCEPNKRLKLFGDLMHMHVNRLFNKDQRIHEMVMYYFLLKDIQRQNALKK